MKSMQDNHPYDSTLMGLNNQYIYYGNGQFYLNTPNVQTHQKKLENGHYYMLIIVRSDGQKETEAVKLVDVFCNKYEVVNILLANKEKNKTTQLVVDFESLDKPSWLLLDKSFLLGSINCLLKNRNCHYHKLLLQKNVSKLDQFLSSNLISKSETIINDSHF